MPPFFQLKALPNREKTIREAAMGEDWIQDGLRHGFVTYFKNLKNSIALVSDYMGMFYERIQTRTQNTYVSLNATRQAQAEKNLAANRLQRFADEKGLDVEKPKKAVTVTAVLEFYEESGCPNKRGRMRYNPKTKTPANYRELPYIVGYVQYSLQFWCFC